MLGIKREQRKWCYVSESRVEIVTHSLIITRDSAGHCWWYVEHVSLGHASIKAFPLAYYPRVGVSHSVAIV